eukprot:COSAG02_NODE_679_length_18565_cov_57.795245_3_plen_35_part_00
MARVGRMIQSSEIHVALGFVILKSFLLLTTQLCR